MKTLDTEELMLRALELVVVTVALTGVALAPALVIAVWRLLL